MKQWKVHMYSMQAKNVSPLEAFPSSHKLHCKKVSNFPVSSRDVANKTLPDREKFNEKFNYCIPGHGEFG